MILAEFLHDLWELGQVTVAGQLGAFTPADLAAAAAVLRQYHQQDALRMPYTAPEFAPEAALWAAQHLYCAGQLALLRDQDEAAIAHYLPDFPGTPTPAAIYSADLSLRHLPALLGLAQGLAPADALVGRLQATLRQWPFSAVGLPEPGRPDALLTHPALRQAYVDRIIRAQDRARALQPAVYPLIRQALGQYAAELWPGFADFIIPVTDPHEYDA